MQKMGGQVVNVIHVLQLQAEVGRSEVVNLIHVLWLQAEVGRSEVVNVCHVLRLQAEDGRANSQYVLCPPVACRRWAGK